MLIIRRQRQREREEREREGSNASETFVFHSYAYRVKDRDNSIRYNLSGVPFQVALQLEHTHIHTHTLTHTEMLLICERRTISTHLGKQAAQLASILNTTSACQLSLVSCQSQVMIGRPQLFHSELFQLPIPFRITNSESNSTFGKFISTANFNSHCSSHLDKGTK